MKEQDRIVGMAETGETFPVNGWHDDTEWNEECAERLWGYEEIGSHEEITKKLKELAAIQREIEEGTLVRVVRCKDCASYVNGVCNLWSEDEFDATCSPDGFCNYAHYVGEQKKRDLKEKYEALLAYDPYGERRKP